MDSSRGWQLKGIARIKRGARAPTPTPGSGRERERGLGRAEVRVNFVDPAYVWETAGGGSSACVGESVCVFFLRRCEERLAQIERVWDGGGNCRWEKIAPLRGRARR